METGGDFKIAQSIFGEHLSGKAKAKGNMARASRASATPTSSMSSCGTTPLSYTSASSGSLARATPTPAPRPLKPGSRFIQAVSEKIQAYPKYGPRPNESNFAVFAEEVLRFVLITLKDPSLKDYFFFFFFFFLNQWHPKVDLYSNRIYIQQERGDLNCSPETRISKSKIGRTTTILLFNFSDSLIHCCFFTTRWRLSQSQSKRCSQNGHVVSVAEWLVLLFLAAEQLTQRRAAGSCLTASA